MGLDTKTGAGDPYTHTMSLLDAIDGLDLFGRWPCNWAGRGELLFGWPSVKPIGFTLTGPNANHLVDLTVSLICTNTRIGADEVTHTAAAFDNVTHMAISTALAPLVSFEV